MDKNLPSNARDMGSIPSLVTKIPHAPGVTKPMSCKVKPMQKTQHSQNKQTKKVSIAYIRNPDGASTV